MNPAPQKEPGEVLAIGIKCGSFNESEEGAKKSFPGYQKEKHVEGLNRSE